MTAGGEGGEVGKGSGRRNCNERGNAVGREMRWMVKCRGRGNAVGEGMRWARKYSGLEKRRVVKCRGRWKGRTEGAGGDEQRCDREEAKGGLRMPGDEMCVRPGE